MNKVQPPPFDDAAAFASLSNNVRVCSHPHLQPLVGTVQASYAQYLAVNGAPTLVQNPAISDALANFLKGHYADPPADLPHITKMRETSKHLVCPMCGSMHSGTLDHYLPKNGYPIFSVFSKNLIPACNCNSRRGEILLGPNAGERVLHPYFDSCLGERLLSAHFEDLGAVPKVSLVLLVSTAHPNYPAISFHVDRIVKRSAVLEYVRDRWSKLIRRPSLIARAFAKNIATEDEVQAILAGELDCLDDLHGSKNNWDSIFLSGLLDTPVTAWIAGRFAVPGRVPDSALI